MGFGAFEDLTIGVSNTAIGSSALNFLDTGSCNVAIGYSTLALGVGIGNGNIALGCFAGNHAGDSNEFFIDNRDRGSYADEKTKGLIYGVFGTTPENQILSINANLSAYKYCNGTICKYLTDWITTGGNTSFNQTLTDSLYVKNNTNQPYVINGSKITDVCHNSSECPIISTTYYPNTSAVTGGTGVGLLNDTFYYDGISYNITEGNGANPLTIYINYTNVTTFSQWILREYYIGSSSHNIQFQIYDYPSSSWESYYGITGQTGFTWITVPIFDSTDHIGTGVNNGKVQTRLIHIENGITSHKLIIDVDWLVSGNNIGASTNLDGYAKYQFGYNNFNGNGDFNTSGNLFSNKLNLTGKVEKYNNTKTYGMGLIPNAYRNTSLNIPNNGGNFIGTIDTGLNQKGTYFLMYDVIVSSADTEGSMGAFDFAWGGNGVRSGSTDCIYVDDLNFANDEVYLIADGSGSLTWKLEPCEGSGVGDALIDVNVDILRLS
jgi:hypothetical protein